MIALQLFGYGNKVNKNSLIKVIPILALADALATTFVDKLGSLQTLVDPVVIILLLVFIFGIDFLSSLVSSIMTMLVFLIFTVFYIIIINLLTGITAGAINLSDPNYMIVFLIDYVFFIIMSTLVIIAYKKDIKLINLKKYKIFNNNMTIMNLNLDNIKLFAVISIPIFIFIFLNYAMYYYNTLRHISTSSYFFFVVNTCAIIVSSIIMFFLIKKIISLKHIETEWKVQQTFLNNINELLKDLRAQKHGFINHMDILNGLIDLKEFDNAKNYLSNIKEIISFKNNVVSVDNPTLSALLNIKAKRAENNNIRFEVNVEDNLSQMNFKAFEIGEALGNIIDNAIDAACDKAIKDKYVKASIYTNDNFYVFDIQNSGKTIPSHVIDRIFEEGFTTKKHEQGEHGFGLYICKNIIDCYNGKIEVESKNNKTSFKIYLPRVIKSEYKLS